MAIYTCNATDARESHEVTWRSRDSQVPLLHYDLPTQDLHIPAMAYNVDGTQNKCRQMTKFMNANLNFGDHIEQVKLYVSDIGKQNIILKYPWLKESNPIID